MNMMKKTGGFTLVELIVVIAILAILAAVAVPAYAGYITKANEAADYTWLDSAKTAIAFAVAETDPAAQVTGAEITFVAGDDDDGFNVKATYNSGTETGKTAENLDITDFVGEGYNTKSGATKAVWTVEAGKWSLS